MTPREVLTALFNEETVYDEPSEAADLMLARLAERGFVIVPRQPTKEIKTALRLALYDGPGGPVKVWEAGIKAATGDG